MLEHLLSLSEDIKSIKITSNAFMDHTSIPGKYTSDGENINPPLTINSIPDGAKSLALIVEDPDAPRRIWVHWLMWNIPPESNIEENSIPGIEGINDFRKQHYGGPCPPSGIHDYHFKIYALDDILYLNKHATIDDLEIAMNPHIIGFGELVGVYQNVS